jgi:hypothetical protein
MSNDNYALWESDESKVDKKSFFETQFNESKRAINNQYSRDEINDKLSQRGMLPSAFPNQLGDSSNNNYTGRLDHEVHSRKQQMNNSNSNSNSNSNNNSNSNSNSNTKNNNSINKSNTKNNNSNIKNNNPIFEHQFFNNKGEYKYNEPINTINSRNLNNK